MPEKSAVNGCFLSHLSDSYGLTIWSWCRMKEIKMLLEKKLSTIFCKIPSAVKCIHGD